MFRFKKHYTLEEARALLPHLRKSLTLLAHCHSRTTQLENRLNQLLEQGCEVGGDSVNEYIAGLADIRRVLVEFERRQIQIKDVERGLVDFPALRDGREVFLCWERDEENIEHWHELDAGFAGRELI